MKKLKEFLKELNGEGATYFGNIISEYEVECNYQFFILNEELDFNKWTEISEIISLDREVNKVNIISNIFDLLNRIKDYYNDFPNKEDYINDITKELSLEYYKRKSNYYFISEILKDYDV